MNKTAIKEFAIEARKKLIASVKDKAGKIGITVDSITEAITTGNGFAVLPTHFGTETTLAGKELIQRDNVIKQIKEKGYDSVMEEVAYTWFNRIIAVRFMEVNDYLPSRVRVLSSEKKDQLEPDLVTQAPNIELDLTEAEKEAIFNLKLNNEMDSLFQMLFIKQCNALGEILPELFENTSKNDRDYTEILLDISYTNEDSVIRDLLKIDEADFLDAVEIIGWMYQYYNTEPKDETFALLKKNVKITKERIPSVTQLFTPDWIVRYMVENSLGRLWLEGHDNPDLKENWKYYLDEAEQKPEVLAQLEAIRADSKNLNLEDIKVMDPAMGSGHILVYAFEVLMQIYRSCGYTAKDAAKLIIEKNLYGLDIDDRAFQLAYFAVLMKARKYNRRILTMGIQINLCGILESNTIKPEISDFLAQGDKSLQKDVKTLLDVFIDAKEYGSILDVQPLDFASLNNRIKEIEVMVYDNIMDLIHRDDVINQFALLLKQAEIMAQKYDVVITNPPYMGSSGMGVKLGDYVKKNYPDSKSDLFAVFIEKCGQMAKKNGLNSLVTMQSWMFLSSFEKIRKQLLTNKTIINLMHMDNMVMGIAFGTAVTIFRTKSINNFKGTYNQVKYVDIDDNNQPKEFPVAGNYFVQINQENFSKIPGMPIAYWVSENTCNLFMKSQSLNEVARVKHGLTTGKNELFVRYWAEIQYTKIDFSINDRKNINCSIAKYFPYNKGGSFRKWYGNAEYVLWYDNAGQKKMSSLSGHRHDGKAEYFHEGITWSFISSSHFGVRYTPTGFIFDVAGSSLFAEHDMTMFLTGLLCSKLGSYFLEIQNPTLNFQVGNLARIPVKFGVERKEYIRNITKKNIGISKIDWDFFETSWDFKKHPLLTFNTTEYLEEFRTHYHDEDEPMVDICASIGKGSLKDAFAKWSYFTEMQFTQLKSNEEEINRIFIEIYGLEDELTPEVEDKDVTIRKADLGRDIRSLISYAVGCMLGRYSLDMEGLAYAGGEWDASNHSTIIPDKDNIIPITDEEYFDDDMVAHLVKFVKVVYGEETLEENLDFIAKVLGNKGNTSREVLRNYCLKDFYKDHVKIYRKRPIYWLFDSGKENGFKAFIYMHRYDEDNVGRVRTDYLHKIQAKLEDVINGCNLVLNSDAPASDKASAVKKKEKLIKQLAETQTYDQAIAHIALQRIPIDLDDGVKMNYAKFQDVEVSSEGKKSIKVNLLAKI
ncbi:BREX-1 system adenine-specific DNA-methyltransferase PglX [Acetobacterium sp.]|uniref:BREX-1 system adenine-specific DNA-methyltransferase PglX n=1 Tax=Acetobacterium sp. TaxID=1872094 RepID=UPI002F3E7D71